jgi:hypothetical protein
LVASVARPLVTVVVKRPQRAGAREGTGEALTGARAGEVLTGESDTKFGVPMPSSQAEGSRLGSVIARTLATLRRH